MQAAAAMSAYTDWAPKQFDESVLDPASSAAAPAAASDTAAQSQLDPSVTTDQAAAGFVYDSNSGMSPLSHRMYKAP